ncbi:regulatory protein RecX [Marinobacterium sediminicola]|uniref:Regulatory protein RecX n=1 Tax=Marinobacterium sediminicola TaxID=518898 RepID=A0ABY1S057_9GAMM|nr:regulatory protein RecX [Marinobacterium sediminicola]ULG69711.1 recombination regulator RecX [Marinobacterium sediminicola]SMR74559.1 regulatory protein [Marinobacterium sediminicola]
MAKALETLANVRNAAIALLARREYSRAELEQKLRGRTPDGRLLMEALDQLQADGYQSDQRFTEVFVRSRLSAGYGQVRIRQELQRKGIGREQIEQVLQQHEIDSRQLALDCYQRRFGEEPPKDHKDYAKRMRFMISRGFGYDDARYALACKGDEYD